MERLFLSVEQAKHLQELGMDMSDSACCWVIYRYGTMLLEETPTEERRKFLEECHDEVVHTYSLQELLEHQPKEPFAIILNDLDYMGSFYDSICKYYEGIKEKEEGINKGEYEHGSVFGDMGDYTIIKHRKI